VKRKNTPLFENQKLVAAKKTQTKEAGKNKERPSSITPRAIHSKGPPKKSCTRALSFSRGFAPSFFFSVCGTERRKNREIHDTGIKAWITKC